MSAESQVTQTASQQQQQQQRQPTLELWQRYLGDSGDQLQGAALLGGTTSQQQQQQQQQLHLQQQHQHGNNNYVNFNQFIMQHNLLGGNGGGGSGDSGGTAAATTNSADMDRSNSSIIGDGFFGSNRNAFDFYNSTSSNLFNNSGNSSNSQLFPYNDSASNDFFINGSSYSNNTNEHLYDNLYTPFGTSSISGTTYYANPFATGFDFDVVQSAASNLHATAPEFVPRFSHLSLNDVGAGDSGAGKDGSGDGEANAGVIKDQLKNNLKNSNAIEAIAAKSNDLVNVADSAEALFNAPQDANSSSNKNFNFDSTAATSTLESNQEQTQTASATLRNAQQQQSQQQQPQQQQQQQPQLSTASSSSLRTNDGINNKTSSSTSNSLGSSNSSNSLTINTNSNNSNSLNMNTNNNTNVNNSRSSYNGFANGHGTSRDGSADKPASSSSRYRYPKSRSERAEIERSERGSGHATHRGSNQRDRYDNHRSNKRRDDWNRNRDRINGFRVDEKYSSDNGKDSPLPSPEKKSPKKIYPENEKLSQREKLMRDIETRRLECLVCVESIKTHQSVWSCNNCYHILHLQCIIKWASSSKSDDGWRCPACQNVVKEVPRDYYCFCGKLKNPTYTRQDIAHSCGEVCGRIEGCSHACTLLCHPGPCPPCQANVKRECGCGKTTKVMQCCLKEPIECDAMCAKLLNCELHICTDKCHAGKCQPCSEKVDQKCHCMKQERQVACTRDSHEKHNYSCGKPCGRDLTCGNHKCKDCCHAGECRPCKQSPEMVTSCPCGKMPVMVGQRTSCLDPIPVCEGVCGKTLRCGKAAHPHHCTSKCHLGNCPPCNKQTAVKCRCGHMDQMIKCRLLSTRADDARCKKRCVKKRSCGKHKCNQECCIDIDHICPLPCNYGLSCGKHKCDQPCHRGNCPPCYRSSFEELFCECGAEVIYPPVPCGTKRPICKRPCSRQHPCEHAPQHNCHSAASCPPCMIFTTKWCFGQHEQRKTIPCSQQSFSCGLACQKPLPCGRHKCIRSCHEGACQQATGEICKQNCTTLRAACGHKCQAPCHDGACPETPCKEMIEVQCECGNRKQLRACFDLAREYSRIATAQLASSMAEMQRGNYMELSEILAPVKANKTNKTLDCNEECRLVERNRRLAIGLQIRNPDLPQKLMTKYSDFIRNFAKRDPVLVKSIYDALTTLVKLAKESKQKSRSHSFPTMNREKRQLVHEMCEMFGVDSVAYDAEPNRNVVATAQKDRSWLPATSIMEVMQREAGQRRVPVPSNNAWGVKR